MEEKVRTVDDLRRRRRPGEQWAFLSPAETVPRHATTGGPSGRRLQGARVRRHP